MTKCYKIVENYEEYLKKSFDKLPNDSELLIEIKIRVYIKIGQSYYITKKVDSSTTINQIISVLPNIENDWSKIEEYWVIDVGKVYKLIRDHSTMISQTSGEIDIVCHFKEIDPCVHIIGFGRYAKFVPSTWNRKSFDKKYTQTEIEEGRKAHHESYINMVANTFWIKNSKDIRVYDILDRKFYMFDELKGGHLCLVCEGMPVRESLMYKHIHPFSIDHSRHDLKIDKQEYFSLGSNIGFSIIPGKCGSKVNKNLQIDFQFIIQIDCRNLFWDKLLVFVIPNTDHNVFFQRYNTSPYRKDNGIYEFQYPQIPKINGITYAEISIQMPANGKGEFYKRYHTKSKDIPYDCKTSFTQTFSFIVEQIDGIQDIELLIGVCPVLPRVQKSTLKSKKFMTTGIMYYNTIIRLEPRPENLVNLAITDYDRSELNGKFKDFINNYHRRLPVFE